MGFYERYELLELDRDDGVKTFQAREMATGRPVKVHLFTAPRAPYQAQLLQKIDELPESERARILDRGNYETTRYVVTDRLADHPGLFEWISAGLRIASGNKPAEVRTTAAIAAHEKATPPAANAPAAIAAPPKAPMPAPPPSTSSGPALANDSDLNREFANLFKTSERPAFVPKQGVEPSIRISPGAPAFQAPPPQTHPPAPMPTARRAKLLMVVGLIVTATLLIVAILLWRSRHR